MDVHLVLAADIHVHTEAEANVYPEKFEPRIIRAQEKYLAPLLGDALLGELGAAVAASRAAPAEELPAALAALLLALTPMVAQWVFYLSLPFLNTSATNRAVEQAPEALQGDGYKEYKKAVQTEAEDRTNDFKKWLAEHAADYPSLLRPLQPKTRRTPGGIVL